MIDLLSREIPQNGNRVARAVVSKCVCLELIDGISNGEKKTGAKQDFQAQIKFWRRAYKYSGDEGKRKAPTLCLHQSPKPP